MNAITQLITQQITGKAIRTIAARLGVSESTAQAAVQIAVPLIATALARNAAEPSGAKDLHQAVREDHDGGILDDIMGYLGNPQSANGSGILGHVLGPQRQAVENNLAQATGLDQGSAGTLLETVAPLVMGAVGRTQQRAELDPSGLAEFLNAQEQETAQEAPDVLSAITGVLDSNQDGSAIDDMARVFRQFAR